MTDLPEIYCHLPSGYSGDLSQALESLRQSGCKVVVGKDWHAVEMLLEVGDPIAVIHAVTAEDPAEDDPFQKISAWALDRSCAVILVGPGDPEKGFTVYFPTNPKWDGRRIAFSELGQAVSDIRGAPASAEDSAQDSRAGGALSDLRKAPLVERLGHGSDAVTIESAVTGEAELRITTRVFRSGEIIVQEEQTVDREDPALKEKVEAQHLFAVSSYAPAQSQPGSRFRGEVSEPILLQPRTDAADPILTARFPLRTPLLVLLAAASVALCAGALYFASGSAPLRSVSGGAGSHPAAPPPPAADETARGAAALAAEARPAEATQDAAVDPDEVAVGDDLQGAVLFPGLFRPGSASFWFRNRGEEDRFVGLVREAAQRKRIRLVVKAEGAPADDRSRALWTTRAEAVRRYLVVQGVPQKQMAIGKPGPGGRAKASQAGAVDLFIE